MQAKDNNNKYPIPQRKIPERQAIQNQASLKQWQRPHIHWKFFLRPPHPTYISTIRMRYKTEAESITSCLLRHISEYPRD